jgi:hypothetical protein
MSTGELRSESVRDPKTGHFLPGFDARRIGSGRKPGGSTKAERELARAKHEMATAKAAELTTAALDRMRADIEHMDERALARFASKPALTLLLDIVNDPNEAKPLRIQAASKLLDQAWAKAPASTLNLHATPASLDQRQQSLLLAGLNEMLGMPTKGNPNASALIGTDDFPSEQPRNQTAAEELPGASP